MVSHNNIHDYLYLMGTQAFPYQFIYNDTIISYSWGKTEKADPTTNKTDNITVNPSPEHAKNLKGDLHICLCGNAKTIPYLMPE